MPTLLPSSTATQLISARVGASAVMLSGTFGCAAPDSSTTVTVLAFVLYKFDWDWVKAEAHFRRAINLDPNYALAHHWSGEFLVLQARFAEGIAELRKAEVLDPLSMPIKNDLGRALFRARRYDDAITQALHTLEFDPNFTNAYATLEYAYEAKGDLRLAVENDLHAVRTLGLGSSRLALLEKAFHAGGWRAYWRQKLHVLQRDFPPGSVPIYDFAEIYTRINEPDKALECLEEPFQQHGDAPLLIGVEPLFDSLRGRPRFIYLLRRSGLPELR